MTMDEKLSFRRRYVRLSFMTLVGMVISLAIMPIFGVEAQVITAVATGYIGIGVSFAGIIAAHFGTVPKHTKGVDNDIHERYSGVRNSNPDYAKHSPRQRNMVDEWDD